MRKPASTKVALLPFETQNGNLGDPKFGVYVRYILPLYAFLAPSTLHSASLLLCF